jgi:hypothetical protein
METDRRTDMTKQMGAFRELSERVLKFILRVIRNLELRVTAGQGTAGPLQKSIKLREQILRTGSQE